MGAYVSDCQHSTNPRHTLSTLESARVTHLSSLTSPRPHTAMPFRPGHAPCTPSDRRACTRALSSCSAPIASAPAQRRLPESRRDAAHCGCRDRAGPPQGRPLQDGGLALLALRERLEVGGRARAVEVDPHLALRVVGDTRVALLVQTVECPACHLGCAMAGSGGAAGANSGGASNSLDEGVEPPTRR